MSFKIKENLVCLIMIALFIPKYAFSSDKKYNVRLGDAPFLIFSLVRPVNLITGEFMYNIGGPFNLGIVAAYLNREDSDNYQVKAYSLGLRVDLVLSKDSFGDGFYLSNAILAGTYNSSGKEVLYPEYDPLEDPDKLNTPECTITYSAKGQSLTAAFTVGYQWFWSNGTNVNLGVGFIESKALKRTLSSTFSGDNCEGKEAPDEEYSSPWFDFGFGYAF